MHCRRKVSVVKRLTACELRIEGVKIHFNTFVMGEMQQTEIDGCASY